MTIKQLLIATGIIITILLAHIFFRVQLGSLVIAPLVFAIWIGFLPDPPEWLLFFFAAASELFSGAPPGIMAAATLLPLVSRTFLPAVSPGITFQFLAIVFALVIIQVGGLVAPAIYSEGLPGIPWPSGVLAIIGTAIAAFVATNIWYEFGVEIKQ